MIEHNELFAATAAYVSKPCAVCGISILLGDDIILTPIGPGNTPFDIDHQLLELPLLSNENTIVITQSPYNCVCCIVHFSCTGWGV